MASFELPPLSYDAAAMEPGTRSNRTSITRISMEVGGDDIVTGRSGVGDDITSHELAPLSDLPSKPAISPSETKSRTEEEEGMPPEAESSVPQIPQAFITFLLISGRRRTMSFEPETTVGRVKELVWNAWPSEWGDERPLGPSYMRVLYLGKMLQDDDTLAQLKFPTHMPQSDPTPTIVHLSVRPFIPAGENDLSKKKRGRGRGSDGTTQQGDGTDDSGTSGCCCIIC